MNNNSVAALVLPITISCLKIFRIAYAGIAGFIFIFLVFGLLTLISEGKETVEFVIPLIPVYGFLLFLPGFIAHIIIIKCEKIISKHAKKSAGTAKFSACKKCSCLVAFKVEETDFICHSCKETLNEKDEIGRATNEKAYKTSGKGKGDEFKLFSCPSCNCNLKVPLPVPNALGNCRSCKCRFRIVTYQDGNMQIYPLESQKEDATTEQPNYRILSCPGCSCNIKMPNPPPEVPGKCTKCSCQFSVKKDKHGNFHIYAEANQKQEADSDVLTKEKCFRILEILENASQAQIHTAFRKKMLEYHPDKVASLGIELKKLSEAKTKQINAAYAFLRRKASNH